MREIGKGILFYYDTIFSSDTTEGTEKTENNKQFYYTFSFLFWRSQNILFDVSMGAALSLSHKFLLSHLKILSCCATLQFMSHDKFVAI